MSDTEQHWSFKDFAGGLIGGLVLAGLGVAMFMNPDAGSEMSTEGRRGLWKLLLKHVWSETGGVVVLLIGLGIVALTIHQIAKQAKG